VEIAPGGSNRCPGCSKKMMAKRWEEIADMHADDIKKRALEGLESEEE